MVLMRAEINNDGGETGVRRARVSPRCRRRGRPRLAGRHHRRRRPTITTGGAGTAGDAWTDDGEPDHLCPVALLSMGGEAETAEHLERVRTVHDNAAERVHDALQRSGHYHPAAELDPERLNGAEKLLVMASDGEAGAGCHAWPPALSDQEITNTRHAIAQYLIEATAAEPAERL